MNLNLGGFYQIKSFICSIHVYTQVKEAKTCPHAFETRPHTFKIEETWDISEYTPPCLQHTPSCVGIIRRIQDHSEDTAPGRKDMPLCPTNVLALWWQINHGASKCGRHAPCLSYMPSWVDCVSRSYEYEIMWHEKNMYMATCFQYTSRVLVTVLPRS